MPCLEQESWPGSPARPHKTPPDSARPIRLNQTRPFKPSITDKKKKKNPLANKCFCMDCFPCREKLSPCDCPCPQTVKIARYTCSADRCHDRHPHALGGLALLRVPCLCGLEAVGNNMMPSFWVRNRGSEKKSDLLRPHGQPAMALDPWEALTFSGGWGLGVREGSRVPRHAVGPWPLGGALLGCPTACQPEGAMYMTLVHHPMPPARGAHRNEHWNGVGGG